MKMKATLLCSFFLLYCSIGNVKSTQDLPISDDLIIEKDPSLEEKETLNSINIESSKETSNTTDDEALENRDETQNEISDAIDFQTSEIDGLPEYIEEYQEELEVLENEDNVPALDNYQAYKEFTADQLYNVGIRDNELISAPRLATFIAHKLIKLVKWVHANHLFDKKSNCKQIKEKEEPQAHYHSPVTTYGYPEFDSENRQTIVRSRLSLNKINGYRVPVHVGAEDWVLVGTFDEIREFLYCFSEYPVIASTLTESGQWKSDAGPDSRHVYVQLQNLGADPNTVSLSNLLWRSGLDRILKRLRPAKFLLQNSDLMMKALAKFYPSFDAASLAAYNRILAGIKGNLKVYQKPAVSCQKLWKRLVDVDTFEERCRVFHDHINRVERYMSSWEGVSNVNIDEPMILTLSSYPRPENECRTTRRLDSSKVTMKQVWDAVEELGRRE